MEQFTIILMEKEQKSGFLTKECGTYTIIGNPTQLHQIYVTDTPNGKQIYIRLTCDKNNEDWEYEAIFDYYDTDVLLSYATTITEEDNHFNPIWVLTLPFSENQQEMEKMLTDILQSHHIELQSVYTVIADKKGDYIEQ